MAAQPPSIDVPFYVQIVPRLAEPGWYRDAEGRRILESATVQRITQERPKNPASGALVAKLTLRIPTRMFLPVQPAAVIELCDGDVAVSPLEATVLDPGPDYDAGGER